MRVEEKLLCDAGVRIGGALAGAVVAGTANKYFDEKVTKKQIKRSKKHHNGELTKRSAKKINNKRVLRSAIITGTVGAVQHYLVKGVEEVIDASAFKF